jgi:Ca2+-binding RTX toxin-like protein
MTITKSGTVIENMIIDGSLRVMASDVVIKNCIINFDGMWGVDAEGARNITIQDCDIIGPGRNGDSNAAILGSGNFLRNDISNTENGVVLTGGSSTVKGNYIHDLLDGGRDPHYDGISVQGGQKGVLIEGNTVIGRDTSDIFIKNDFGPISDVTVKGNLLLGDAGYTIYVDGRASGGAITGVNISNNYVEKGFYGHYSVDKSSPVISGNVEFANGATPNPTLPPPNPTDPSGPIVPGPTEPVPEPPVVVPPPGSTIEKIVNGTTGSDKLFGSNGADAITGGMGKDVITSGGGNDRIIFNRVEEIGRNPKTSDVINDFQQGKDKIDLSAIDANGSASGNTAFHLIAKEDAAFDRTPGALAWRHDDYRGTEKDMTVIQGDINGDGVHDFEIYMRGLINLTAADFQL